MRSLQVYIVEDSAIIRDRLIALLSDLGGIEVVGQAEGATAALDGVRRLRPDVVILDLQLAEGSGFEVLKGIKQGRPAPRVLVLTNHTYPPWRTKCLEAGADSFFDKATEFGAAVEVLRQWGPENNPKG